MTTRQPSDFDFDRTIDAWLAIGPTELSDRVVQSARAEVARTRRQGTWRRSWIPTGVFSRRLVAGLATVVVIAALVGVGLRLATLPPNGTKPSPSPTDLASPGPLAGKFQPTGSMTVGRLDHTATLLPDGRVLIAGGSGWVEDGRLDSAGPIITETAELYDPTTGTFSPTGSMTTARGHHTATLLLDGRVLITGGGVSGAEADVDPGGKGYVLASAELYDPTTGTFTATGSMRAGRLGASAVRLEDGRVLVVGGIVPTQVDLPDGQVTIVDVTVTAAELYDPTTGQFTAAGSFSGDSYGGLVLLGDGRVLGISAYDFNGTARPPSIEFYDPASAKFTQSLTLPDGDYGTTVLADGQVLFVGGVSQGGAGAVPETLIAQLFDPATGVLSPIEAPGIDFQSYSSTRMADGRVLLVGFTGRADAGPTSAAVIYDPKTTTLELLPDSTFGPDPRGLPQGYRRALQGRTATLLLDGRVLLAGGGLNEGRTRAFTTAELFE
jgi:hypothetical protein